VECLYMWSILERDFLVASVFIFEIPRSPNYSALKIKFDFEFETSQEFTLRCLHCRSLRCLITIITNSITTL